VSLWVFLSTAVRSERRTGAEAASLLARTVLYCVVLWFVECALATSVLRLFVDSNRVSEWRSGGVVVEQIQVYTV